MARIDHHRRSIRLDTYDYRNNGIYFITFGTQNRHAIFGEIRHGIMGLSDAGCIMAHEWQKTATIRPYVILDEWIIMPDHFHAILHIHNDVRAPWYGAPAPSGLTPHSLGSIIGQLKIVTTKQIRTIDHRFAWHRNYYERIIRTDDELDRTRQYILDNPKNWRDQ